MRGRIAWVLAISLILCAGCGETQSTTTAQAEPAVPTGGVSMYPLSAPVAAPPMQGFVEERRPAQTDPYAVAVTTPYAVQTPAANYAPTVGGRPSPYAGITTTTTYSAPTYATTSSEVFVQPTYAAGTSPAWTSTASGQYCEVTDTSESSLVIPMVDPPILVGTSQVTSAGTTTTYYAAAPASAVNAPPPVQASEPLRVYPVSGSSSHDIMTPVQGIYVPSYNPNAPVTAPALYAPAYGGTTTTAASYSPYSPPPAVTTASLPQAGVVGELRLVPAPDIPPGNHPNDYGPSQWFEIIRPGNGPIRIGRVSATCVCVGVRVPVRHVAAGQRALVEARTVSRPPANNVTYGLYVQVLEPTNTMLDVDVTVSARR